MSNALTIYFDARMLGHSGIGTQIEEVISNLLKSPGIELYLIGKNQTIYEFFPHLPSSQVIDYDAPIYSIKEQIRYPKRKTNKGLYHFPHYNANLFQLSNGIVVIHDLIHLDSDEFKKIHYQAYAKLLLSNIVRRAKAIVTVSRYTKQRLQEVFPFHKDNIYVVHNGINHEVFYPATKNEISEFKNKYHLPNEFLLVVGIGKKHKNLDTLLIALKRLWKEKNFKLPLVVAGTNRKVPNYVKDLITKDIEKNLLFLPFIPKQEIRLLYASSLAFIMPSKIEGFGFPLLEAMACGVPTISSNKASLPEIAEKATLYFDPYNPEEIEQSILKITHDSKLRNHLIQEGKKQAKKFDWKTHVRKLIEIYKKYY
ncbi:MAG: glycosyltransferase family 4 protein [Leptospiraceae bacterium]|nr:glycosyltransferase family 4 protein [Leptospiraceae bacterium]MDW7976327.1 glycosyltransferase family 1 protein [Leptospiraceae bacterium]